MPANAKASPLDDFVNSSMVIKIIIVTTVAYLIDNLILQNTLTRWLAFHTGLFSNHYAIWQPVTYLLTHDSMDSSGSGILHILFNMYSLWLFGRAIEYRYGSREFLAFYVVFGALAALAWWGIRTLTGNTDPGILIGASGSVTAIVILFALNYPQQKLQLLFPPITVPAWVLGVFIVLMDVRGAMGQGADDVAFLVHLAGAALALAYFYSGFSFTKSSVPAQYQQRVAKQQKEKLDRQTTARHTCTICNVTELTDRKMQFRYCSKCVGTPCYCENHIHDHEHIQQAAKTEHS